MNWNAFTKTAAHFEGDVVDQVSTAALTRWAVAPAPGLSKVARELACASLVGARLVDAAIEKLAFSAEEKAFLRELNAEAAGRELASFTKTAFFGEHPRALGAAIGAAAGAGLGAWKDEDDRLRGAAIYALPGAAIGFAGGAIADEVMAHGRAVADAAATERATAAAQQQAEQAAHQAGVLRAVSQLKSQIADAKRFHGHLVDAAHIVASSANDVQTAQLAQSMAADLARNSEAYINHSAMNPGKIHPEFLAGYLNLPGNPLKKVLDHAHTLYAQG